MEAVTADFMERREMAAPPENEPTSAPIPFSQIVEASQRLLDSFLLDWPMQPGELAYIEVTSCSDTLIFSCPPNPLIMGELKLSNCDGESLH